MNAQVNSRSFSSSIVSRTAAVVAALLPVLVSGLAVFASSEVQAAERSTEALKYLPVQDAGRIKPFDTLARESLQLVYGGQTFKAPNGGKRSAHEIVMTWFLLGAQYWDTQEFVEVNHKGLKDSLKLPAEKKYFSPAEIFKNDRLALVMQELEAFRVTKQKLTPFFQAAQRLESQLSTYQGVKQGLMFRVVPPRPGVDTTQSAGMFKEPDRWTTVAELEGEAQDKFKNVIQSFVQALPNEVAEPAPESAQGTPLLEQSVEEFKAFARSQNPEAYPSERDIALEVHFKTTHPFMYAWIFYLLAAIFAAMSWQTGKSGLYKAGWTFAILAFLIHCYGFGLRMYLTGRPPVSNMYETVIWVSWGTMLFAFFLEAASKRRFILVAGSIVAVLCLIVADLAPTILDQSLQPLEPVLRSNMWLTVHVLTITLSYSAFFLAWGLANIGLSFVLKGDPDTSERMRVLVQSIYRSLQVGVVLLAAGTILGGVWADYSWGRFWGWDPKETWALIALLGYLAVLHGRLVGWVRNFGMLVGSIVAFNLVIMAWYGVNFVLGAGLHSYGFGAGGIQYVGGFVILNLIYLGYTAYVRWAREKAGVTKVAGKDSSKKTAP